jgi:hypothetical protein
LQMVEIDRPVARSQRWRWHPFYPFEVKRHDLRSGSPRRSDSERPFSTANHAPVNGTFSEFVTCLTYF